MLMPYVVFYCIAMIGQCIAGPGYFHHADCAAYAQMENRSPATLRNHWHYVCLQRAPQTQFVEPQSDGPPAWFNDPN